MNLQAGCYLMSFRPMTTDNFGKLHPPCIGTLRVTSRSDSKTPRVSGDLYSPDQAYHISSVAVLKGLPHISIFEGWKAKSTKVDVPSAIPHFAIDRYRYHLEIHDVIPGEHGVGLDVTAHEYDVAEKKLVPRSRMRIALKLTADGKVGEGYLLHGAERRGEFALQWISRNVRSSELRLFAVAPEGSEQIHLPGEHPESMTTAVANARLAAEERGNQQHQQRDGVAVEKILGWKDLFQAIHWELNVTKPSAAAVPPTARPEEWAAYDLSNAATLLRADRHTERDENGDVLDPHEWFYDLLCVPRFESPTAASEAGSDGANGKPASYLGIMFDTEATDLNQQPRESAAVAALELVPEKEKRKKVPFQDLLAGAAYYRTALHEVGHAMNLTHNFLGRSLMNTTGMLLQPPQAGSPGKEPVASWLDAEWKFTAEDAEWLQHAPDIVVRPGGISRRGVRLRKPLRPNPAPIALKAVPGAVLTVTPVSGAFPYGAPVRLDYQIENLGAEFRVPADISLRGGCLAGRVTGPDSVTRFFRSAFRCCDAAAADTRLCPLEAKKTIRTGMTILRGIDGPLFPEPGAYRIEVELRWDSDNGTNRIVGQTSVVVLPPNEADPLQVVAAVRILSGSAMMPALVQGLINKEGLETLSLALRSSELAPHYLSTALKCKIMGTRRGIDWEKEFEDRPEPVESAVPSALAPARVQSRLDPLPMSSDVERPIVQTQREVKQLEAELSPRGVARASLAVVEKVGRDHVVVSPETSAWIDAVRDLTLPKGRSPSEFPLGSAAN